MALTNKQRKPRPLTLTLSESSFLRAADPSDSSPLVIDEDKGIIYGVRVGGLNSPNNHGQPGVKKTRYLPEFYKKAEAAGLYENVEVKLDHNRNGGERSVNEPIGVLRNFHATADGGRADLHYKKSHPFSGNLLEDVKRRMGTFGLSHNAVGSGHIDNGELVLDTPKKINSVDLVDKPATVKNLWESNEGPGVKIPLREYIMRYAVKTPHKNKRRLALKLSEAEYMAQGETGNLGDTPVEQVSDKSPEEHLKDGFQNALIQLVKSYISGECTLEDFVMQVEELAESHENLTLDGDSPPDANEKPAEPAKDPEKDDTMANNAPVRESAGQLDKQMQESQEAISALNAQVRGYRHKEIVREIFNKHKKEISLPLLESLAELPSEQAVRKAATEICVNGNKPKSSPAPATAQVLESSNTSPNDPDYQPESVTAIYMARGLLKARA